MTTLVSLALLIGCGGSDPTEPDPTTPPGTTTPPPTVFGLVEVEASTEVLHDGPVDAALPAGEGWVGLWGGERTWTTGDGEVIPLGPGPVPRGAAEAVGTLWLLDDVDGITVRVGSVMMDAGLGALLPGSPTALQADGDDLWIQTDGGLVLWSDEQLFQVTIDGAPAEGPAAPGAVLYDEKVTWIAHGGAIHALAGNGFAWKVFETRDLGAPVDSIRVVGGRVLASAGGRLWVRDQAGWWSPRTSEVVGSLVGGLGGAWELGPDAPRFVADDALWAATEELPSPAGRWWADGLGRLVLRTDTDVRRVALHRPLRLLGVAAGDVLDAERAVSLVPTAPEHVTDLALSWVRPEEPDVPVALADGAATLDPTGLLPGAWTLHGTASYDDRDPSTVDVPVLVTLVGDVTWTDHVEPIHARSCAVCHEGETDTVLDGPDAWEANIDAILTNISNGSMPLGGPRLSSAQVDLVQAWKDGGFVR